MRTSAPVVGSIDIGTNTVLLLVAERGPDGAPRALVEHAEITRLGQGVDRTRTLAPEAVARTLAVLERYAAIAAEHGVARIAAVATSASRDATNGAAFRDAARAILGRVAKASVEVVSGAREAALTFQGALGALPLAANSPVAVVDIGGGSTEIVLGRSGAGAIDTEAPHWSHSYDVGSVRLSERHVRGEILDAATLRLLESAASAVFSTPSVPPAEQRTVVGIAGTVTSYAAMELELADYGSAPPHGATLTTAQVRARVERLAPMPLAQRQQVVGLEPKRADVIVAGGVVLLAALKALGAERMLVSDRGVRWGLAAEQLAACSADDH